MTTASDNFDRAGPGLGGNWTSPLAGHTIVANAIVGTSAVDCRSWWNADSPGTDQQSTVLVGVVAANNQYCGVVANASGATSGTYNGYEISTDGSSGSTHTELARWDNGVQTVLANFATTYTTGVDTIGMATVKSGSHYLISCFKNGTQVGSTFDDASPPAGADTGHYGIATFNTATLDNWIGTDGVSSTPFLAGPGLRNQLLRSLRPRPFAPGNPR